MSLRLVIAVLGTGVPFRREYGTGEVRCHRTSYPHNQPLPG